MVGRLDVSHTLAQYYPEGELLVRTICKPWRSRAVCFNRYDTVDGQNPA